MPWWRRPTARRGRPISSTPITSSSPARGWRRGPAIRSCRSPREWSSGCRAAAVLAWIVAPASAFAPAAAPARPPQGTEAPKAKTLSDQFEGIQFRNIGPFRGGRSCAVVGVRHQPHTFYFGGTGGGVWKTTDGGSNWEAVSDKDFKTGSIGASAVSDSDPNVVYVGTGEAPIRGNVSHGDGVYKSTDGGQSWKNVGLKDSRQIARIRIHPDNPDV